MEDKNLTAVEWLEAIIKHCERFGTNIEQKDIEEAKEMEKQQMMDCYLKADVFPRKYEFEEYYKETYGK